MPLRTEHTINYQRMPLIKGYSSSARVDLVPRCNRNTFFTCSRGVWLRAVLEEARYSALAFGLAISRSWGSIRQTYHYHFLLCLLPFLISSVVRFPSSSTQNWGSGNMNTNIGNENLPSSILHMRRNPELPPLNNLKPLKFGSLLRSIVYIFDVKPRII